MSVKNGDTLTCIAADNTNLIKGGWYKQVHYNSEQHIVYVEGHDDRYSASRFKEYQMRSCEEP